MNEAIKAAHPLKVIPIYGILHQTIREVRDGSIVVSASRSQCGSRLGAHQFDPGRVSGISRALRGRVSRA